MDEWPLGEAEHEVIREIFRMQLRRFRLKPLLDYLRNRKLDWDDVAPNPPFNRSVVSLWSGGKRFPSRAQIEKIKIFNQISDGDLQLLDRVTLYQEARSEAIQWIRQKWFQDTDQEPDSIRIDQLKALDLYVDLASTQMLDNDKLTILDQIRKTYPNAEIWRIDDLNRLLDHWLYAHCGFNDAMMDEDLANEC